MGTNYYSILRKTISACCVFFFLGTVAVFGQDDEQNTTDQDSTKTGFTMGRLELPDPNSIESKYTYDPILDRYIYTQQLGSFNITYPLILTPEEYERRVRDEEMKKYFKEKVAALDGKTDDGIGGQKNLLPNFYVKSELFQSIFGGDSISLIPQGSVEMDLGLLYTKQDNPSLSPRSRSNFSFDFDQRISLSLLGKVGERLQITANYDTESTFDFQNQIKLEYTPTEDDIIQKIEIGNISMPLNSALIQGSQSLFGVKTELQFGKTRITAAFSESRSQQNTVTAEGGATVQDFEVFALDYDEDRHFFLAQYFRDTYNSSLANYPFINSNIQITRLEVWVTNRQNQTTNARNIVAIQDIGESDPANIGLDFPPSGFLNNGPGAFPDNKNNDFNPFGIDNPSIQSVLTNDIRDIASVQQGFGGVQVNDGVDYVLLENARKLELNQYSYNARLGYLSLSQRLSNDEVLGVAFQYTVNGQVFQVGEFANDGIEATTGDRADVNNNGVPDEVDVAFVGGADVDGDSITDSADASINGQNFGQDRDGNGIKDSVIPAGQIGSPQNLVVKMLKSNLTNVSEPVWDLMMKNIYPLGAFNLEQEGFRMNIVYSDPSPLNYLSQVGADPLPEDVANTSLLRVFNLDRLTTFGDPQVGGDGFFDFVPGTTVRVENGSIIFTSVEPFGEYLFDKLRNNPSEQYDDGADSSDSELGTYNSNQREYVYKTLYSSTKTIARDNAEKNKFLLKGRYKSTAEQGIPLGAFNVPQGSVTVRAGGRLLVEGLDYTVNYQLGRVIILDKSLEASGIPISAQVENNATFGQQNKRFTGINVEHTFNENFIIGGTYLNMSERPLTQKATYSYEPINNTIFGLNASYSTEVPFLTRLANKLPNIDTDAPSNFSIRGEMAYLLPGQPKGTDFNGEATSYVDDFEGSQTNIDVSSPLQWYLSSAPVNFGGELSNQTLETGYRRSKIAWYTIDPVFYNSQRPGDISDNDLSSFATRRVFRSEIFPQQDIVAGQPQALFTLDLAYFPEERGAYNYNPTVTDGIVDNPRQNFGGIMRQLTSTDFEQSNVEFIEFWLMDPFIYDENAGNTGGKLTINLGSISEDILKDGRKQYENGLPGNGTNEDTSPTIWGKVPTNQSLVYAFDSEGQARTNQDIGYDGLTDAQEADEFPAFAGFPDPAGDNYDYFLNASGGIIERYKQYNGQQGNSPVDVGQTNRGSTTFPDIEDVNRDNTMNTVDSYFEYEIEITPQSLDISNEFVSDVRELQVTTQNNATIPVRWLQFRIPISQATSEINSPNLRAVRFMRLFMNDFADETVLRFGTLDLVRGDYRRYVQTLDVDQSDPAMENTLFEVAAVNIEANENRTPIPYVLPPGVQRERLNNNNNNIRQNEQSMSIRVQDLEGQDARGVYKNFRLDMRQYKRLEMFLHAEQFDANTILDDNEMVAFIRMGTDITENFYQVEVPLTLTPFGTAAASGVWPELNNLELPLELLQTIKAKVNGGDLSPDGNGITFFDANGDLISNPENTGYTSGEIRVGMKGLPSFGDIRTIMLGVKNGNAKDGQTIEGEVWFNELRLTELNNSGGWAAILNMDANIADFATVSATGRQSTAGFGGVEQGPNERSREDVQQYDVVTNVNLGQLLPKKWGINLPFNYAIGEEVITPLYDPEFKDIELETSLANAEDAAERAQIEGQSIDYTRRKSINFIGVRKDRTGDSKPQFYDVENFTLSYSYNQTDHKDFEIEQSRDQNLRAGAVYNYAFQSKPYEPFKKNDSLFTGRYWKFLKDFNVNYLPTNVSVNSNITRQYNRLTFRDLEIADDGIQIPKLYQRNYLFDWAYSVNFPITKSLRVNYNMDHKRVVRNYLGDEGEPLFLGQDEFGRQTELDGFGLYSGLFDIGTPNTHFQTLQANYTLPFDKFPFLDWIKAEYSYTANFTWQRGSQQFAVLEDIPDLGNYIENGNTHAINGTLDMENLYKYVGLTKKKKGRVRKGSSKADRSKGLPSADDEGDSKGRGQEDDKGRAQLGPAGGGAGAAGQDTGTTKGLSGADRALNSGIGLLTAIKRVQFNYQEDNGISLPGYTQSVGFAGTIRPTAGFVFGSQAEVRELAARNGWLTLYQEFNEQYREVETRRLDGQIRIGLIPDLDIDVNFNRIYQENYAENYRVDPTSLQYESLTGNVFGNFNISTLLIGTAFSKSTAEVSDAFNQFRENRLVIAERLATKFYGGTDFPRDENGYPVGFGRTNQSVLLPAFVSAYTGGDAKGTKLGPLRDIPLPNWNIKYTGLMKIPWFKKQFKRFSVQHGYTAGYTINQFNTNLAYNRDTDGSPDTAQTDQAGNFLNRNLYSTVTLTEQFSPLIRLDFEMKNSVKILAEIKRDRALGLSFDNNLLTEISGDEYILGLGYRIKDLTFATNFGGKRTIMKSDLNFKADFSLRRNETVIRYLDIDNSQTTAGQDLYGLRFTADYALSKNLTALFFYDHTFSTFKISTAFPQTTIRSGFTLRYNFGN